MDGSRCSHVRIAWRGASLDEQRRAIGSMASLLRTIGELRTRRYEAVLDLQGSPVTAMSLMLTCWLLTGTAEPMAQVWLPRVPLILGALVVAALWRDLGQLGREIPRQGGVSVTVRRMTRRWPFRRVV